MSLAHIDHVPGQSRTRQAEHYLDAFSKFTAYRHGRQNARRAWLHGLPCVRPDAAIDFLNYWYPVSRHQPQLLLFMAAALPDWQLRRRIMNNYLEEDGMLRKDDRPHYVLLEQLICKLGGSLRVDPVAEDLVVKYRRSLGQLTAAQSVGHLAAVEHPALDISAYFHDVVAKCGYAHLLATDPYLVIHVHVEPDHIVWAHGTALDWMDHEATRAEVIEAYQQGMKFWDVFWERAFAKLGYPGSTG